MCRYKDTRIMLGVIAVCKSAVESVPYVKVNLYSNSIYYIT